MSRSTSRELLTLRVLNFSEIPFEPISKDRHGFENRNLMATLDGRGLRPFNPGGDYLTIFNLGDGTGIFQKRRVLFNARLAFIIKDFIDRRVMRKFQGIEG
ncbi:MAG: hypothetical protein V2B19_05580 [Pseudomonadota bacterium]